VTKTLIIGGAGFIGAHLARSLAEMGEPVDVLDNFSRGVRDHFLQEVMVKSSVRLINADIFNPTSLSLLGNDYNVIYQLAAIIGVRHVLERPYDVLYKNVVIQANSIDLAKRQKALDRFVFASTSEVYAGSLLHMDMPIPTPENFPLALTDLAHPRTSYMLSKIYGEALCQQSSLPFTIVRPHNIYGPRMGLVHVLPELIMKACSLPQGGQLEVASVEHRRAFCYIDDAVEMLRRLAAASNSAGGTFNLGNEEQEIAIGDVARIVLLKSGRTDLEIVPIRETAGSPTKRCPDMTQTIAVTGFSPTIYLAEGIQRTLKWYRENIFTNGEVSAK
jgi:UDP-glucose 4-epimerase